MCQQCRIPNFPLNYYTISSDMFTPTANNHIVALLRRHTYFRSARVNSNAISSIIRIIPAPTAALIGRTFAPIRRNFCANLLQIGFQKFGIFREDGNIIRLRQRKLLHKVNPVFTRVCRAKLEFTKVNTTLS